MESVVTEKVLTKRKKCLLENKGRIQNKVVPVRVKASVFYFVEPEKKARSVEHVSFVFCGNAKELTSAAIQAFCKEYKISPANVWMVSVDSIHKLGGM